MAIQNRRGVYGDFDPTKMVPGEFAVVQNGDPLSGDGKSVYIAFNAGSVKRILLDDETMPEGFTDEIKSALLSCFRNVAWINDQGQACYDALESALYGVRWIGLNTYSLAASATGGTAQLVATTIPAGGAVAWTSSNTSVATVSASGLVTFTGYGSASVTASSNGKTATCSVLVAQKTVTSISATYTQSGVVYESDVLDDLKVDLVVSATWSDASETVVSSSEYVLSGELTAGTSTVTVSYGGKTTTFDVVVSAVELASISADFEQGSAVFYTDTPLDDLKPYLTVTANYDDGTSAVVTAYTLVGVLAVGESTITATYSGKTATFTVTVTSRRRSELPAEYEQVEYIKGTGTQYLSTNVLTQIPISVRAELEYTQRDANVISARNGSDIDTSIMFTAMNDLDGSTQTTEIGGRCGYNNWVYSSVARSLNTVYNIVSEVVAGSGSNNVMRVKVDDESPVSLNVTNVKVGYPITLCIKNGDSWIGRGTKFHSVRIYSGSTELFDGIPCYRKSDDKTGLFDAVTNAFFPNEGTGEFEIGNVVY